MSMHTFSKALIQKTIQYFKNNYSLLITEETAEEYLTHMAGLFESFLQISLKQNTPDTTDGEASHTTEPV